MGSSQLQSVYYRLGLYPCHHVLHQKKVNIPHHRSICSDSKLQYYLSNYPPDCTHSCLDDPVPRIPLLHSSPLPTKPNPFHLQPPLSLAYQCIPSRQPYHLSSCHTVTYLLPPTSIHPHSRTHSLTHSKQQKQSFRNNSFKSHPQLGFSIPLATAL